MVGATRLLRVLLPADTRPQKVNVFSYSHKEKTFTFCAIPNAIRVLPVVPARLKK